MGKIVNILNGLFKKVENTTERYEKALETKQEELIAIQAELAEKASGLSELHKMYLLSDVSEATYKKEADAVEKLQKKVSEIQHEMQLIQEYKTDDVQKILFELEANNKEVQLERQKEVRALQLNLLKAKHEYLAKMIEAREEYYKIVAPEMKIEQVKASLGMKNKLDYMTGADSALSMYSTRYGYINLEVDTKQVYDAFSYKRIDYTLEQELQKHNYLI